MNDTTSDDLIQVAVPRRHLIAVYGLLAKLDDAADDDTVESADGGDLTEVTWTVDELRRFASTPTATSVTIGKVLDVLAANPDKYLSTSDLEQQTGVPRANLKGAFSALTRHINKHYDGRDWMLSFKWGPTLGADYPAQGHYSLSEEQAARWKEARQDA